MYQFSYNEVVDESPAMMRDREREAIDRVIEMLRNADSSSCSGPETVEALYYLRRLWSIFLNDLQREDNDLPEELRSNLISIGIWVNKEIDAVQCGSKSDLKPLIDINQIIRDGLR